MVGEYNDTPLVWACFAKGNLENVWTLLARGVDISLPSKQSNSTLHIATRHADGETIGCLINHNMSVNFVAVNYTTPLFWACSTYSSLKNVLMLVAHGADLNYVVSSKFENGLFDSYVYDEKTQGILIRPKIVDNAIKGIKVSSKNLVDGFGMLQQNILVVKWLNIWCLVVCLCTQSTYSDQLRFIWLVKKIV